MNTWLSTYVKLLSHPILSLPMNIQKNLDTQGYLCLKRYEDGAVGVFRKQGYKIERPVVSLAGSDIGMMSEEQLDELLKEKIAEEESINKEMLALLINTYTSK